MRSTVVIVMLVAIAGCVARREAAVVMKREASIYDRIHEKNNLPTGGEFMTHPKKVDLQFYVVNKSQMWDDNQNHQKLPGIYISKDSGRTWKLHRHLLDFRQLFIHPETDAYYAIVYYDRPTTNEHGFLTTAMAFKALKSKDAKHWKDITRKEGWFGSYSARIIQDPDHPNRVCVALPDGIYQSTDDNYSEWIWHNYRYWDKRKKPSKSQQTTHRNGANAVP